MSKTSWTTSIGLGLLGATALITALSTCQHKSESKRVSSFIRESKKPIVVYHIDRDWDSPEAYVLISKDGKALI